MNGIISGWNLRCHLHTIRLQYASGTKQFRPPSHSWTITSFVKAFDSPWPRCSYALSSECFSSERVNLSSPVCQDRILYSNVCRITSIEVRCCGFTDAATAQSAALMECVLWSKTFPSHHQPEVLALYQPLLPNPASTLGSRIVRVRYQHERLTKPPCWLVSRRSKPHISTDQQQYRNIFPRRIRLCGGSQIRVDDLAIIGLHFVTGLRHLMLESFLYRCAIWQDVAVEEDCGERLGPQHGSGCDVVRRQRSPGGFESSVIGLNE